jgi:hypothetical protein
VAAARLGRMAAQSREAQVRRAETQHRHVAAPMGSSDLPDWLDEETFEAGMSPAARFVAGVDSGHRVDDSVRRVFSLNAVGR